MQSRYYCPEIGRFVNADAAWVLGLEQGNLLQFNLFAYCFNNPVNLSDPTGYSPKVAALPWIIQYGPQILQAGRALLALFGVTVFAYEAVQNPPTFDVTILVPPPLTSTRSHVQPPSASPPRSPAAVGSTPASPQPPDNNNRGSNNAGNNLPNNARTSTNFDQTAQHLQWHHGVDPRVASQRLHRIKNQHEMGGRDNVIFDRTGNVFDQAGRWIGSLTR